MRYSFCRSLSIYVRHLRLTDLHSCPPSMRTANLLFVEANHLGLDICNSFLSFYELTNAHPTPTLDVEVSRTNGTGSVAPYIGDN